MTHPNELPYNLGEWFDELAKARAERDRHGCELRRAVFMVGSRMVRGYVFTYPGGNTWGYRRMSNGSVRMTYFPLEPRHIISIEKE